MELMALDQLRSNMEGADGSSAQKKVGDMKLKSLIMGFMTIAAHMCL